MEVLSSILHRSVILSLIAVSIGGCGYSAPDLLQRVSTLQELVKEKDLKKEIIKTEEFNIYSISRDLFACRDKKIDVYIEGDGLSWITSDTVSSNPTPVDPLGLKLFLQDPRKCSLYLARPCQYIKSPTCEKKYWTSGRFSPEVIESFSEVLDKIKKISNASSFRLFGYSGGGAVAAILAAKRDDISELITICGNLDIAKWANEHYITPLYDSLNPADFSQELRGMDQVHLIGGRDKVVGESVFKSYLKRFKDRSHIRYRVFQDFNHHCCWEKRWREVLSYLDE